MTAAVYRSSGPNIFSMFSAEGEENYRAKRETFALAMLGQAALLGVLIYLTTYVIPGVPPFDGVPRAIKRLPLVLSYAGGGGTFDPIPASHGAPPKSSPDIQLAPPEAIVLNPNPRLTVTPTIAAPVVTLASDVQLGDPSAPISNILSNGRGGPEGMGDGCCNGVGPGKGPGTGLGTFYPGRNGVTVPVVIYNPDPIFSDEARKSKTQGNVELILLVDTDGHTRDIHVQSSLGMGLDEKAVEAVSKWRFHPATLNGKPVPVQIAVDVNFRLY